MAGRRRPELWAALAVAAALVAGCRTGRPPMHPETPPGRWYVVSPGETLALIAQQAGVPAEDLRELNGIERDADVKPGALLYVLSPTPAAPAAETPPPAAASAEGPAPALRWPLATVPVTIGSPFGARWGKRHEGIDLPAPIGTPVFAAADGKVVYAGNAIRGYGNLVVIKHAGDLLTAYAHNSVLLVSQGQPVRAGDRIALVGQSGHATGPHLHFEVRSGQIPRDPMRYLPPLEASR
ncbi:MAG TPA: M23 family metallopeptidase [Polyangia bacterium]|nr:M23 family metallopeptidase [Polyangia bacterium]